MNEKHREVKVWLDQVFAGDTVPPQYEINHRTVDILYGLMQKNVQQDKHAEVIIEDLRNKAEEYTIEGDRLAGVLQRVGLTSSVLSQSGMVSLRTLASVALSLEVKDASDTSLILGMSERSQEAMKLQEARRTEQRLYSQLFSKTKAALHRSNGLNRALESLEEQHNYQKPELEKKIKQSGFLENKGKEYRRQIQKLQVELTKSGASSGIYHSTLVKKAEDLKELKDKLHPLKAKLDSYHKLPPDQALAKVKVEEVRRELARLEAELAKQIDLMHI